MYKIVHVGEDPTWLAVAPCMRPILKEALSDYISKIKEEK